jgi:hypothetical protein
MTQRGNTTGPGPDIGLIDPPGLVGRLELTAQPPFQLRTVSLHPTPDRRVICLQPTFGEQLFDVSERERVPQIPAQGAQNQLRCRLPPLEDCRSGCVLHDRFSPPANSAKVATHPRNTDNGRSVNLACGGAVRPRPGGRTPLNVHKVW